MPGTTGRVAGVLVAPQGRQSGAACALLAAILCLAALSAYAGPFIAHDGTGVQGPFAVVGEDDSKGRQVQFGPDETGDAAGLLPGPFDSWGDFPRPERESASGRFQFRKHDHSLQLLERAPPGL